MACNKVREHRLPFQRNKQKHEGVVTRNCVRCIQVVMFVHSACTYKQSNFRVGAQPWKQMSEIPRSTKTQPVFSALSFLVCLARFVHASFATASSLVLIWQTDFFQFCICLGTSLFQLEPKRADQLTVSWPSALADAMALWFSMQFASDSAPNLKVLFRIVD